MRRHGWALCLGAVLAGSAAAQPPAGGERVPPAPDLPGEVVGRQPVTPADGIEVRPTAPPAGPLPAEVLAGPGSIPAAPTNPTGPAVPGPQASSGPPGKAGCGIGFWEIKGWLLFHSQARQSGHYVSPYRPPLYAWFPCEPGRAACGLGSRLPTPGCAPGMTPPTIGPIGHGGAPASPEPPLAGGMPVGKCLEAEVLTTFQPVAPGLGFAPGAAPMANPTTQVKPTSYKPK